MEQYTICVDVNDGVHPIEIGDAMRSAAMAARDSLAVDGPLSLDEQRHLTEAVRAAGCTCVQGVAFYRSA